MSGSRFQRASKTRSRRWVTCSFNLGTAPIRIGIVTKRKADNTPPSPKMPLPPQRLFIFLPQILPTCTRRPLFSLADACYLGGLKESAADVTRTYVHVFSFFSVSENTRPCLLHVGKVCLQSKWQRAPQDWWRASLSGVFPASFPGLVNYTWRYASERGKRAETRLKCRVQGLFPAVCWHCWRSKCVSEYLGRRLSKRTENVLQSQGDIFELRLS